MRMDGDGRMALHGMWLFEHHERRGGNEPIHQPTDEKDDAEGKKLSQTILDQLEDWGEGKIKSGEIEFIESSGDIYSNRQVVILFQELLNISLSSEDTNITELARYIHKVTGRNIETIRTYIKRLNKVDEYPNKDINRITKDLEQISPELAKAIRARFD